MPVLGAPKTLQEDRHPCLCLCVSVCVPVCVYVCHNISNLLQTFAQLAFVVLLYPPPLAATHNAVLSPAHRTFEPRCDAYVEKQWVRYVPGLVCAWPLQEEHIGLCPAVGVSLEVETCAVCSPCTLPYFPLLLHLLFFVNKYGWGPQGDSAARKLFKRS